MDLTADMPSYNFQLLTVPKVYFYFIMLFSFPHWHFAAPTVHQQQWLDPTSRWGTFNGFQVIGWVVIACCGRESFLSTTVSCAFHVVLSHSLAGRGHVGQDLTDVLNEHRLSGGNTERVYHQEHGDSTVAHIWKPDGNVILALVQKTHELSWLLRILIYGLSRMTDKNISTWIQQKGCYLEMWTTK